MAKSYTQMEGINYNSKISPVMKHFSIRILLALVAQLDLELIQMDVKIVNLYSDLEDEIYMTQPKRFRVVDKENYICKLNKSLYRLKQSLRQWYKRFDKFMLRQRYIRSRYDD